MAKHCLRLLVLIFLLLSFSACSKRNESQSPTDNGSASTTATYYTPGATPAIEAKGTFQEYTLPQPQSGLMRPAADSKGRIWFGEMGHNSLTVFDPATEKFEQLVPPGGAFGIMGVAVASDDTVWFAEQYANYIGCYDSQAKQFRVYQLPKLQIPDPAKKDATMTLPFAPNEVTFDAQGNVWFTAINNDSVGMLDPKSGIFRHFQLSPKKTVQTLNPYGITVDPQGKIWFTESSANRIGRLDPKTGKIEHFTPPGSAQMPMQIASDSQGIIWATSFNSGMLLRFDPETTTFTHYTAPYTGKTAGGLYGLTITPEDKIWIAVTSEDVIAQLDILKNTFLYYKIPTTGSRPLGIVMGSNHTLWFTESGSNKIGLLKP